MSLLGWSHVLSEGSLLQSLSLSVNKTLLFLTHWNHQ